jgi:hypothetical protein
MIGPIDNTQDEPFNADLCRHQLLLLKSLHCGRPVLYQGLRHFISCMTANRSGCDIDMTVYLAGRTGGLDCREIEVPPNIQSETNDLSKEETS